MLGEIKSIQQYGTEKLFDRFVEVSRMSHVPVEFEQAFRKVAPIASPGLISRPMLDVAKTDPNYQEIAYRLVKESFSSSKLAAYGLYYGLTISAFKLWDSVAPREIEINREIDALWLEQRSEGFDERISVLRSELTKVVAIKEYASCQSVNMLAHEHIYARGEKTIRSSVERVFRRTNANPMLRELREVREYMEQYFEDSQNCVNLVLLS